MKNMQKKELIKEDHWHNIPIENTTDKIFSIIFIPIRQTMYL